jgi:NAD(P)-dependent dehydrogenase (short-subunit alcohol dehydrogenase family)
MADKVMIVTGGSRGIGAATARLGAAAGYGVIVNYAGNVAAAEAVCHQIHANGGEAVAVRGDVSRPDDIEHIFAAADRMGPLAALVNNAGTIGLGARVEDMDATRIAKLFAVNVAGSFLCAAAAIRRMSTRHGGKGGAIVNVTSAAAKLGAPGVSVDYAATKGAIDTFTIGLALELAGEGIRVNAVRPGIIDTEFHATGGDADRVRRIAADLPMGRAGTSDEVAEAILWLASDAASYTTGTILSVTGGRAITP